MTKSDSWRPMTIFDYFRPDPEAVKWYAGQTPDDGYATRSEYVWEGDLFAAVYLRTVIQWADAVGYNIDRDCTIVAVDHETFTVVVLHPLAGRRDRLRAYVWLAAKRLVESGRLTRAYIVKLLSIWRLAERKPAVERSWDDIHIVRKLKEVIGWRKR